LDGAYLFTYLFVFTYCYLPSSAISISECTYLLLIGFLLNYEKMDCGQKAVRVFFRLLPQH